MESHRPWVHRHAQILQDSNRSDVVVAYGLFVAAVSAANADCGQRHDPPVWPRSQRHLGQRILQLLDRNSVWLDAASSDFDAITPNRSTGVQSLESSQSSSSARCRPSRPLPHSLGPADTDGFRARDEPFHRGGTLRRLPRCVGLGRQRHRRQADSSDDPCHATSIKQTRQHLQFSAPELGATESPAELVNVIDALGPWAPKLLRRRLDSERQLRAQRGDARVRPFSAGGPDELVSLHAGRHAALCVHGLP
jgi:hypothetical protein